MAGIKLAPEEPETTPQQQARATATDSLASDDDRSIAADSWSIKSEYGSTLDDDQRHADAAEALSSANFRFIRILGFTSTWIYCCAQFW